MSKQTSYIIIIVLVLAIVIVLGSTLYIVSEKKQVIITQFGDPIGDAVTSPGIHLKVPFIQKANYFEKRWLEWDGDANQIPTKIRNSYGSILMPAGESTILYYSSRE